MPDSVNRLVRLRGLCDWRPVLLALVQRERALCSGSRVDVAVKVQQRVHVEIAVQVRLHQDDELRGADARQDHDEAAK
eukprot:271461-Prymnesium_polylepis.1